MARRTLIGACCLALITLTCGCSDSDGTASPKSPTSPSESAPGKAKPAATDLNVWAIKFCLAVRSLGNVYIIDPPIDPDAADEAKLRKLFGTSRDALDIATKTAAQIGPTGVSEADRLTDQLRRSLNTTGPRLTAELDAGSKAEGAKPSASVGKANKLLGTIHPNSNDLFEAAQTQTEIGSVIKTTMGCPTQIIPLPTD
ncbi:hypothetical protein [Actinomadura terrae]|uniref:hypothetical protein n=1 Tax=Actinomadura terrae TaxID=604353 RepID=UPI001FA80F84|nr:hypothetical protein [Actinomadura terrae]